MAEEKFNDYLEDNSEAERISNAMKYSQFNEFSTENNEMQSKEDVSDDENKEFVDNFGVLETKETFDELTRGQGDRLNVP